MEISPLAPAELPHLSPIAGVKLAAMACGIRYQNRVDVLLAEFAPGTHVAGVLTRSLTASAPVLSCRTHLPYGTARGLVVNAGNSNAFTGAAGEASVARVIEAARILFACDEREIYLASTGVIGEKLPDERITANLAILKTALKEDAWAEAARAIMTTDTFPKMATRTAHIGDTLVHINGIAKGSGMIAPDMATLLAFVFTDAAIAAPALQKMLTHANEQSFNCLTVAGDTSTSDTALLFATGAADNPLIRSVDDPILHEFKEALNSLMIELAQLVARDGEGASKLITVHVTGAEHDNAAKRIALTIANSPLVKTAIAGEDANWGRIVAAIGRAGERAERDKLRIHIGGILVAENGAVSPAYKETELVPHMQGREIDIRVDAGIGQGRARVWTCDLTHGYIDINGSYRS